jgi:hypothetical protein
MKRGLGFFVFMVFLAVATIGMASASTATCTLSTTMINQDPYPAVPGESVKVLFQVRGVEDAACGEVRVGLVDEYPFSLDPSSQRTVSILGGTFVRDHPTFLLAPFTLRVDRNALDGESTVKIEVYNERTGTTQVRDFQIEVKDVKTEFEVFIRNYDKNEMLLTLEVINIGKNNVEALVIEIPSQQTVTTRGSNRQTIGILDSNEDTTARFGLMEARDGEIEIRLRYNDLIGERREIIKNVHFNPDSFDSGNNGRNWSISTYLLIAALALIAIYWVYGRYRRKDRKRI